MVLRSACEVVVVNGVHPVNGTGGWLALIYLCAARKYAALQAEKGFLDPVLSN